LQKKKAFVSESTH